MSHRRLMLVILAVSHRRLMVLILALALVLDAICGILYSYAEHIPKWHGLYCALANGVTVGCDVPPATHYGFVINTAEFFLVIPLFGATFGLFTGLLADVHVRRAEERIKQHVTDTARGPDSHQAPGPKTG